MKLFLPVAFTVLTSSTVTAVDCNACNYNCRWYDFPCHGKKTLCKSTASVFGAYTSSVETICDQDPDRMAKRELIQDAKDLLVHKGLFTQEEVDHAKIRWCSALGGDVAGIGRIDFADGMAPSSNKVLLHKDYMDWDKENLAVLLAHELYHIRQYRDWGSEGFNCRYMQELASFEGTGRDNRVEEQAYNFEDEAEAAIFPGHQ